MALSKNAMIAIAAVAIIAVAGICAAFMLNNGNNNDKKDDPTDYPNGSLTITTFTDYNGNKTDIKFTEIPDRVVCGCNTALNLLLYLGLEDKIVGCYYNEEPIWEGVQSEYDKLVKRIGAVDAAGAKNISGNIQKDVLLSWQPDLVIGWVAWEDAKLGSESFWNDNGCNVMSFNAMTSADYRTVEMMKTDYDNVGKIFKVSDKTTKLYNDTVNVINDVKKKLDGKETIYYALVDGAVNTEKGTVWCYKNSNFIASVLNSIGLTNAFPDGGTVSLATVYEVIGTTDIDLIFYITYGGVTYQKSLESWQKDADLSKCAAIKNGDVYDMKLSCSYGSTPQLLDAMNKVYESVNKIQERKEAESSYTPYTMTTFTDYNGNTVDITFNEMPDRVVCGCNTALNLLLYLGLEDKIVGCYYNEEPIWEGVQSEYDKLVKRIGAVDAAGAKNISGNIQKDVLLSWQPDLVIGWVAWEDAKLGSEAFWNENGCNVMSFNAMTSAEYRTVEMMKTDYDNVGKIFDVSDKTTELYNDTIQVIADVKEKLEGKDTVYYALVDGAVNTEKGTVWCYKDSNFIASVLNSIGLTNAFPNGGTVSLATVYEAIGTTDIDLIFYITYGGVTYQKSLESWQKDADLSKCAAIKNGDAYDMKLSCSYGSTPQLLDAMEKVYDSVDKILERKATVNNYPFSIETFIDYNGNTATITFDKIPERVVCGCCTALNLLLYLGMGDRIVGCYYNEEPIWEGVQDEYDKLVKRIGAVDAPGSKNISGNIQKDVLLSWQPDLVIGWVAWEDAKLGTEAFWNENGCNVMSLNAMTSADYRTVEMMKTDYDNIGKIFSVPGRTTALYNKTVSVIDDIAKKLEGKETVYYALVDGAVNTEKGTVWCYKNSNFIASVLNSIGLTNAFPDGGTVPLATVYEAIGTTDIDLIFYITYGGVTYQNSLKSWQDDADLSKCAAIKNGDAYDMKLSCSYGSTPQLLDAMEKVYECVVKILDRQSAA